MHFAFMHRPLLSHGAPVPSGPAFLAEQWRVCGDDKEYMFVHKCKTGTVSRIKGHCRNLHAPRPNARKAKPDPRLKQLENLIEKRARLKTNDVQGNHNLSAQIRGLRAELKPPTRSCLRRFVTAYVADVCLGTRPSSGRQTPQTK